MKKYVIDASTCLKWVFEEPDSPAARTILADYQSGKNLLLVPEIWPFEIANAFNSARLSSKITAALGQQLFKLILQAEIETIPIASELSLCLTNSATYNISIYDSAYVTLAKHTGCAFITSDTKLASKVGESLPTISPTQYLKL